MVVRVDRLAATFPADLLGGDMRDHLVGVHVRRCAAPRLEDIQHELVVEPALDYRLTRRDDGIGLAGVQQPQRLIRARGGLLDEPHRLDERAGKSDPADREILGGSLGLCAV